MGLKAKAPPPATIKKVPCAREAHAHRHGSEMR